MDFHTYKITTTGLISSVSLADLGMDDISHPTTDLDLIGIGLTLDELESSDDLYYALKNGYITAVFDEFDRGGVTITSGNVDYSSVYDDPTIVNTSGDWESTYNTVLGTSANWETAYSTVLGNSGQWVTSGAGTITGYYDSDINFISGQIDVNDNDINNLEPLTGNWDNVYSTVNTNSGGWEDVESITQSNSANWISAYASTSGSTENVVVVAKSGGQYTTIQGAIDAITDASISKNYVVSIMPGTYTENLTVKSYINLRGANVVGVTLVGTITFPDDFLNVISLDNMQIQYTYSTAGSRETIVDIPNCLFILINEVIFTINSTTSNSYTTLINIDGGVATIDFCRFVIDHDATSVTANNHKVFHNSGNSSMIINSNTVEITSSDEADNYNIHDNDSTSTSTTMVTNNNFHVTMSNTNYSGNVDGFRVTGVAAEVDIANNHIDFTCTGATPTNSQGRTIVTNSAAGGARVYSISNVLRVEGFDKNVGFETKAGDLTYSRYDFITADIKYNGGTLYERYDILPLVLEATSEGSSTTTSTTLQNKTTLTITPSLSGDIPEVWKIEGSWEVRGDTADMVVRSRLRDDTVNDTVFENWNHINTTLVGEEINTAGFEVITLGLATPSDFIIQWKSDNGANTATCRKARILGTRIS